MQHNHKSQSQSPSLSLSHQQWFLAKSLAAKSPFKSHLPSKISPPIATSTPKIHSQLSIPSTLNECFGLSHVVGFIKGEVVILGGKC